MNANIEFEIKAAAFKLMTGRMAPGKDVSIFAQSTEEDVQSRWDAWDAWTNENRVIIASFLRAIDEVIPS